MYIGMSKMWLSVIYNINIIIKNFTIGTPNFGCRGYLCDDRTRCFSYTSVCNGYTSCTDGSDEENCCKA